QAPSSIRGVLSYIGSLPGQAVIIVSLLVIVSAVSGVGFVAQNHLIWTLCYGFLLAWVAGMDRESPENASIAGTRLRAIAPNRSNVPRSTWTESRLVALVPRSSLVPNRLRARRAAQVVVESQLYSARACQRRWRPLVCA